MFTYGSFATHQCYRLYCNMGRTIPRMDAPKSNRTNFTMSWYEIWASNLCKTMQILFADHSCAGQWVNSEIGNLKKFGRGQFGFDFDFECAIQLHSTECFVQLGWTSELNLFKFRCLHLACFIFSVSKNSVARTSNFLVIRKTSSNVFPTMHRKAIPETLIYSLKVTIEYTLLITFGNVARSFIINAHSIFLWNIV